MAVIRESDLFELMRRSVSAQMLDSKNRMLGGSCHSFDEYKFHAGVIAASKRIMDEIDDLEKRFLEE